jgi:hypothetical protein
MENMTEVSKKQKQSESNETAIGGLYSVVCSA